MRLHHLLAALAGTLACASSQSGEHTPATPETIAGTWAYQFMDMDLLGGSIVISNDTSEDSFNEVTFAGTGGIREYRGVLRALLETGSFVCWTDETQQVAGLELTAHAGRLQVTYFDECIGITQRPASDAQRPVRHCRHTPLSLRRTAPP